MHSMNDHILSDKYNEDIDKCSALAAALNLGMWWLQQSAAPHLPKSGQKDTEETVRSSSLPFIYSPWQFPSLVSFVLNSADSLFGGQNKKPLTGSSYYTTRIKYPIRRIWNVLSIVIDHFVLFSAHMFLEFGTVVIICSVVVLVFRCVYMLHIHSITTHCVPLLAVREDLSFRFRWRILHEGCPFCDFSPC